ncbi:MAG TPA: arginase family protein [Chitinophagaceae bacterium]|nr:arginase family protein [Chitinophagaceae bacterium]
MEYLAESLLSSGLAEKLKVIHPVVDLPTLNHLYSDKRDKKTNCLNAMSIRDFSLTLSKTISFTIDKKHFAMVLGGDCSILLGIMSALKTRRSYGLIFIDAHADFYEPEKSTTGEVADMDLAIVTGRGPEVLTNINNLKPYVKDENVIHIGQRDWDETKKYGSQDIRETKIKCISLADIEKNGIEKITGSVLQHIEQIKVDGFWLHFDTDVLADEINPAVDYRIPGGLLFGQAEYLIRSLLLTGKMTGISITIFNPTLDKNESISKNITDSLGRAFDLEGASKF